MCIRDSGNFLAYVMQLLEEDAEGHAVSQCLGGGILYDGAIGHGVREWDAYFYHLDSFLLKGLDGVGCAFECGMSCAEVYGEDVVVLCTEEGVDSVHCIELGENGWVDYFFV